ncbi:hypothetical protein BD410DRAFT_830835 [Rickenella mellea]|uniref:BZIP domain-containing protein n=1 Tax=Rickenella mellea TaxID=50990 RepID=A0A4Y7PTY8_9AGAM|nr:hypothetical protein BD410DRAFT_830835 [Rickenella mellea]
MQHDQVSSAWDAFATYPQYSLSPALSAHSLSSSSSSSNSSACYTPQDEVFNLNVLRRSRIHLSPSPDHEAPVCMPTHRLFDFDFPQSPASPTPSSSSSQHIHNHHHQTLHLQQHPHQHQQHQSLHIDTSPSMMGGHSQKASAATPSTPSSATKRPAAPPQTPSAPASAAKKPRTCVSTKDFIPPDVSGLSKREARLVKNRAAAFLSRQRKREEFETMEVHVAELEAENARLLSIVQGRSVPPSPLEPSSSSSAAQRETEREMELELDQLRAELTASQQREASLTTQLSNLQLHHAAAQAQVKKESPEPLLASPAPSSSSPSTSHVKGASLGLMVLLCALPSLLSSGSTPAASATPATQNPRAQGQTSTFAFPSARPFPFSEEFDSDSEMRAVEGAEKKGAAFSRLAFEFAPDSSSSSEEEDLNALDLSFSTTPSPAGLVRIKVHNRIPTSSLLSQRSSTPPLLSSSSSGTDSSESDSEPSTPLSTKAEPPRSPALTLPGSYLHAKPQSHHNHVHSHPHQVVVDDFLGVSSPPPTANPYFGGGEEYLGLHDYDFGLGMGSSAMGGMGMSLGNFGGMGFGMGDFGLDNSNAFASFPHQQHPHTHSQAHVQPHHTSSSSAFASLPKLNARNGNGNGESKGETRRVRIALREVPGVGSEGGEWDVSLRD